jgi:hypothetical protein
MWVGRQKQSCKIDLEMVQNRPAAAPVGLPSLLPHAHETETLTDEDCARKEAGGLQLTLMGWPRRRID